MTLSESSWKPTISDFQIQGFHSERLAKENWIRLTKTKQKLIVTKWPTKRRDGK